MSRQTLIKLLAEPTFRFAKINEIDEAPFPASDTSVNSFFSSSLSVAPKRKSRNASLSINAFSPSSRQAPPSSRPSGWTSRSPKHPVLGGRMSKRSPRRKNPRRTADGSPRKHLPKYYINDNIMLEFTPAKLASPSETETNRTMNLHLSPMYPGGDIANTLMKY